MTRAMQHPRQFPLRTPSVALLPLLLLWSAGCGPNRPSADSAAPASTDGSDRIETLYAANGTEAWRFEGADFSARPPVQANSPEAEGAKFLLPPGYRLEPVLTEPEIEQPGAIAFDANGRMYVLELRSYMLDADATDELAPISRISRWEDRDNDGVYETGTVFVDHLIFPRFVTPLGDGVILTKESNSDDTWMYTDTNGDGVSDRKELFVTGLGRAGNVEHQEGFLTWAMDNWMYSTYNSVRVRWTPDGVLREPVGSNGAQWGVTQDDYGKVWFQGGASGVPSYFQFPIQYGNFRVPDQYEDGFQETWGAGVGVPDMQGGMPATRMPEAALKEGTGAAGNDVYRGDRLPADLKGDYVYGEPVARIVRRIRPTVTEGLTQIRNLYQPQKSEFIRSTDPLFRPVDMATAPDGTLYIVDMYHGIIQEGEWAQPGSYLRRRIEQYQLDKIIERGRIWRLTYDGIDRDPRQPRMFTESSAELVSHLTHPNGWWRDMAQQQLVLRQDRAVVPALTKMAQSNPNPLARIHALWTLEGLGSLDATLARTVLKDPNPKIRAQAIRASESLYKGGDRSFAVDYKSLARDTSTEVAIQALMTLNTLRVPEAEATIRAARAANSARGVQLVSDQILSASAASGRRRLSAAQAAVMQHGERIYGELCSQCHGETGMGTPAGQGRTIAPPLASSDRVSGHPEYLLRVLLHGLTGPVAGVSYEGGIMPPQSIQNDEWIAAVASYIRTNLGNDASFVTPEEVARVRTVTAGHAGVYQYDELTASIPKPLRPLPSWVVTATDSVAMRVGMTGDPAAALTLEGWMTGTAQRPGMWIQVELPRPELLTEIQFVSPTRDFMAPNERRALGAAAKPVWVTAPRRYRVELSMDGTKWTAPVAEGEGTSPVTTIAFEPSRARFIRILQTGTAPEGAPWSIREMQLFAIAAPE